MFEKKTSLIDWPAVRKLSEIGCNQDSIENKSASRSIVSSLLKHSSLVNLYVLRCNYKNKNVSKQLFFEEHQCQNKSIFNESILIILNQKVSTHYIFHFFN